MGHTLYGPNRADIRLKLGGRPVAETFSRGQQKTLVILMKIAQGKVLSDLGKQVPFCWTISMRSWMCATGSCWPESSRNYVVRCLLPPSSTRNRMCCGPMCKHLNTECSTWNMEN